MVKRYSLKRLKKISICKNGSIWLNLGCGKDNKVPYIGVDKEELPNVDIVADLNKEFPFPDNSADRIVMLYVLEHLDDFDFAINEVWRVCKDGADVIINVPYFSSNLAFYEYHKTFFNIYSFQDFTQTPRMKGKNMGKFDITERRIIFPTHSMHILGWLWERIFNHSFRWQKLYDETFLHYLIPAVALQFKLEAKK